ncbi:MAG: DUF3592 domain-containing protein [Halomonas sp.]|uniref:DUF3592 domain-containing protein n=1 Tax=Halomonas sp. TaxID=1486246 RepID=UPI002ACEE171|nr:DUF3592 domain-containing protein [Halomonas sp.]MDZ7852096.1 DUF3592 domain-containing protein [Halomonas sp.]
MANRIPRAAIFRISVLLAVVLIFTVAWEYTGNVGSRTVKGTVIKVEPVFGGRGSDNRKFTVRYKAEGQQYTLNATRGLVDRLMKFSNLDLGSTVPVAVSRDNPARATLDSFNSRYPISLTFGTLAVIFYSVIGYMAMRKQR